LIYFAPVIVTLGVALAACSSDVVDGSKNRDRIGADAAPPVQSTDGSVADVSNNSADAHAEPPYDAGEAVRRCLPPCLYEALSACGVPWVGGPAPDPNTCRTMAYEESGQSYTRTYHVICDPSEGYMVVPDAETAMADTRMYFKDGELCLARSTPTRPGDRELWATDLTFTNVLAEVVLDFPNGSFPPILAYCGDPEDPATLSYEMDVTDPACDAVRRALYLEFTAECPPGECPWPLPGQ
jgi:hypothetical protein